MEQQGTSPKRLKPYDEAMNAIVAVYNRASGEEKLVAQNVVKRAVGSAQAVDILTFAPAVQAILFFDHNKQNREWDHATAREYERQIRADAWAFTNQGIGFLTTGDVGDGQHRLAAGALAERAVTYVVTFGLTREAIVALDAGKSRVAADFLRIEHLDEPVRKTALLRSVWKYLERQGDATKVLHALDNRAAAEAVIAHDEMLTQAMLLGARASAGIAKPILTLKDAQGQAFLLLMGGWPEAVILDKLTILQRGQSTQGESAPLFIAAKILDREATKRDRPSLTARYAAAMQAMRMDERGIKATKATAIREAMKPKQFPDPHYPVSE